MVWRCESMGPRQHGGPINDRHRPRVKSSHSHFRKGHVEGGAHHKAVGCKQRQPASPHPAATSLVPGCSAAASGEAPWGRSYTPNMVPVAEGVGCGVGTSYMHLARECRECNYCTNLARWVVYGEGSSFWVCWPRQGCRKKGGLLRLTRGDGGVDVAGPVQGVKHHHIPGGLAYRAGQGWAGLEMIGQDMI